MQYPSINSLLLWLLCFAPPVQSLTLFANRLTSSRRVSPIPQLKCVGPSKTICDKYKIETTRCTNAGYDYDEEDVQWTCTAPLPEEFMLGATDVICEGYRNADDKWVLKGSCGVEYRLLLTERGERRFGKIQEDDMQSIPRVTKGWRRGVDALVDLIFLGFWAAVLVMILWPMVRSCFELRGRRRRTNVGRGGGGGGGGAGGGNDYGPYPGPPPPYSSFPDSSSCSSQPGWRPGFWTGAATGGMAGYEMGRRSNRHSDRPSSSRRWDDHEPWRESSTRPRSPPRLSATTESTGFGSTRRR
ncbi:DUF1183 domain protein [Aspergillus novofumigatus IBT 16806]|uniref:Store-operated calcium entry-associated regulatory factor n=1 Tax=Aspergillus novofumigatus (strain IBT 16806) TaxID=1392255 RepID=A0A2I1CE23_ASPN1|nr:DUF1183-domain-containing protein [Aspergillus novofumigatus IBT 16806]PKX95863.1 DUF1183-domain-containing protein [Aspergillus novofumigatus IBT 16806]